MSMLTPPGMGGKYRVKGDRYPRMRMQRPRNRRRLVLVSLAAVTALGLLGWGTLQLVHVFSGNSAARASDSPGGPPGRGGDDDCRTAAAGGEDSAKVPREDAATKLPEPGSVTVNVLNATKRSGLAKSTSDQLEKRGFRIGKVGNAPAALDKKVKSTGVLLGAPGKEGTERLKVLGTQLEGAETRYDERDGKEIDLVIGNGFEELAPEKSAAKALAALSSPAPSPVPTRC